MDEKDLTIQELRAKNKKLTEELEQLKSQPAAGDLISRQEAIDRLSEVLSSEEEFEKAKEAIIEAPTAYNVDEVLEQIKELRRYCDNTDCKECKYKDTCFDAETEKIIKAGGVNG